MPLRYRPIRPEDVVPCVQTVQHHPLVGPTYGNNFAELISAWKSILDLDACRAILFEEQLGSHTYLLGPGVWVAVSDEFATEIQSPPFVWQGPELARRIAHGSSPVLTNHQFRVANASTGLNIVAWPSGPLPDQMTRADVNHLYMSAFVETVRGHRVRQAFFQTSIIEELKAVVQWGAAVATAEGLQPDLSKLDLGLLMKQPVVLVMNESLASSRFGSWASGLFVVGSPQIGFSRAEQHLLEAALRGLTDEELTVELQVSLSAIKKTWRSIYSRVERSGLRILPVLPATHEEGDRGKGKRHRLLNYLREHPEELRPVSMKLLRQNRASSTDANLVTPPSRRRRVGRPRSNSTKTG